MSCWRSSHAWRWRKRGSLPIGPCWCVCGYTARRQLPRFCAPWFFVLAATIFALLRRTYQQLDIWGLLLAQLLAECAAVIVCVAVMPHRFRRSASMVRLKRIKATVMKARHFLGAISAAQVISTLNQSLPTWIVGSVYGAGMADWLALAQRLALAPVQLVSTSVGGVVSQRSAVRLRTGQPIYPILRDIVVKMSAVSGPAFVVFAVLAYYLTGPIFGAQWRDANTSVSLLAVVGRPPWSTDRSKLIPYFVPAQAISSLAGTLPGW